VRPAPGAIADMKEQGSHGVGNGGAVHV
jgi:hypothetical protein